MKDMRIKVKTELLQEASGEVRTQVSAVRTLFDEIGQKVLSASSYWEGDGNLSYVQAWGRRRNLIEQSLRAYEENADDLERIAGIYVQAEKSAQNLSGDLYTDVIV